MRYFIEVERRGPEGTVLVTLRDGPLPEIGLKLKDEAGHTWRVRSHLQSEVVLAAEGAEVVPTGMALIVVKSEAGAHAA